MPILIVNFFNIIIFNAIILYMTNWTIQESESAYEYVGRPTVQVGDTIEIASNNQEGYRKYKVIMDADGNKDLRTIADWSIGFYEEPTNEEDGLTDDEHNGGKRRRYKRRNTKKNKRYRKSKKSRKNRRSRRY
jgi:hypothetical protein